VLSDRVGRPFLKMRYVVNDECNYNCLFCHFEGQQRRQGSTLTAEDYEFASYVFSKLGVYDFKLTGGEPLLRRDIDKIVEAIARVAAVSITTNGLLLRRWVDRLYKAGLRKINVSIHTADPEKYFKVVGAPTWAFKEVLRGLQESRNRGLAIKLNAVVLRGINTDDKSVKELVKLAASFDASLQFIELMPSGSGLKVFGDYYEPIETIAEIVTRLGGRPLSLRKELHNRPLYKLGGVTIELIKNYNNPTFCSGCTTMRLTSDGKLKTCIYAEPAVDLAPYIKNRDVEGMVYAVKTALASREPRFNIYASK